MGTGGQTLVITAARASSGTLMSVMCIEVTPFEGQDGTGGRFGLSVKTFDHMDVD